MKLRHLCICRIIFYILSILLTLVTFSGCKIEQSESDSVNEQKVDSRINNQNIESAESSSNDYIELDNIILDELLIEGSYTANELFNKYLLDKNFESITMFGYADMYYYFIGNNYDSAIFRTNMELETVEELGTIEGLVKDDIKDIRLIEDSNEYDDKVIMLKFRSSFVVLDIELNEIDKIDVENELEKSIDNLEWNISSDLSKYVVSDSKLGLDIYNRNGELIEKIDSPIENDIRDYEAEYIYKDPQFLLNDSVISSGHFCWNVDDVAYGYSLFGDNESEYVKLKGAFKQYIQENKALFLYYNKGLEATYYDLEAKQRINRNIKGAFVDPKHENEFNFLANDYAFSSHFLTDENKVIIYSTDLMNSKVYKVLEISSESQKFIIEPLFSSDKELILCVKNGNDNNIIRINADSGLEANHDIFKNQDVFIIVDEYFLGAYSEGKWISVHNNYSCNMKLDNDVNLNSRIFREGEIKSNDYKLYNKDMQVAEITEIGFGALYHYPTAEIEFSPRIDISEGCIATNNYVPKIFKYTEVTNKTYAEQLVSEQLSKLEIGNTPFIINEHYRVDFDEDGEDEELIVAKSFNPEEYQELLELSNESSMENYGIFMMVILVDGDNIIPFYTFYEKLTKINGFDLSAYNNIEVMGVYDINEDGAPEIILGIGMWDVFNVEAYEINSISEIDLVLNANFAW